MSECVIRTARPEDAEADVYKRQPQHRFQLRAKGHRCQHRRRKHFHGEQQPHQRFQAVFAPEIFQFAHQMCIRDRFSRSVARISLMILRISS